MLSTQVVFDGVSVSQSVKKIAHSIIKIANPKKVSQKFWFLE